MVPRLVAVGAVRTGGRCQVINAILPLVILALVAWGVTAAVRRRSDGGDDGHGPAGTLRRLFWYAALAVGVGLTATGVSELIGLAVPVEGDVLVGEERLR